MTRFVRRHAGTIIAFLGYLAAWAAAVAVLAVTKSDAASDGVTVLVVFGLTFSGAGWLTTIGVRAPTIVVRRPGLEVGVVVAFLAAYAVLFTGFGLSAFHAAFAEGRVEAVLLVAFKLLVHVALPCLLLVAVGASPRALFTTTPRGRPFWLTLFVLGPAILATLAVISPSLKEIGALKLAPASLALASGGAFVWIAIEAGLCEEFLFRAVLQSRLAAALKNEAGAVVIGALVFGLVHAPGLYMRGHTGDFGHSQNLIQVVAYTVAVLSPAGLFLGFVWSRTRNLLLVVVLHALVDVLPFIPVFSRLWF